MRQLASLVAFAFLLGCAAPAGAPRPLGEREIVDLTHPFDASTIYWPTAETGFQLFVDTAGYTDKGFYYSSNHFAAPEHGGTHIDAPIHFAEHGHTLDAVPLRQLIGPGVHVDVSRVAAANPDYLVTVADLEAWESAHGRIPAGAIVLLDTGWAERWPDRERYLGTAEVGADAVPLLHFPGLDPDAATWLVHERSIGSVGLDTASIDYGQSSTFDSHQRLMAENVPALENVANLGRLPATGFTVIALPIKIAGGTGGPLRVVAVLD